MNSAIKLGLVIYQDCQHRYKSCALVFVVWFEFHSEESKICFWENIAWFVSRHAPVKLRKMQPSCSYSHGILLREVGLQGCLQMLLHT